MNSSCHPQVPVAPEELTTEVATDPEAAACVLPPAMEAPSDSEPERVLGSYAAQVNPGLSGVLRYVELIVTDRRIVALELAQVSRWWWLLLGIPGAVIGALSTAARADRKRKGLAGRSLAELIEVHPGSQVFWRRHVSVVKQRLRALEKRIAIYPTEGKLTRLTLRTNGMTKRALGNEREELVGVLNSFLASDSHDAPVEVAPRGSLMSPAEYAKANRLALVAYLLLMLPILGWLPALALSIWSGRVAGKRFFHRRGLQQFACAFSACFCTVSAIFFLFAGML